VTESSKKQLKTAIKIVVTILAVVFVVYNIEWSQVSLVLSQTNYFWLVPAILFFVISKVFSALRLQVFLRQIDVNIKWQYNLKLAWIGMFYNLFLPGGIGGDAYKVFILKEQFDVKTKLLAAAALVDRINGVVVLAFLAGLGFFWIEQSLLPSWVSSVIAILTFLTFPSYLLLVRILFKSFKKAFLLTSFLSICTQGSQVIAAIFILSSFNIQTRVFEYLVLFLASSIVAVLPFTIGGVGARELTFIIGNDWLGIDQNTAVAFSMVFFLITLLVSGFGGFFSVEKNQ